MPIAPNLPPDQLASAQANAGLNPVNFLIAAADMQKSGKIPSAPVPTGKPLQTPSRRMPRKLKVVE